MNSWSTGFTCCLCRERGFAFPVTGNFLTSVAVVAEALPWDAILSCVRRMSGSEGITMTDAHKVDS